MKTRTPERIIAHWQRQIAFDYTRHTTCLACSDCGQQWVAWTSAWWVGAHAPCPQCQPNSKRRRLEDEEIEYGRVDVTEKVRSRG